jgi:alpha-aminoadipic semialdehyde synthase
MKTRIGIRREDKNKWEKRTPLIPIHVRQLIDQHNMEIWIQPSSIRIFTDEEYRREGALIKEDLSPCQIIFSIKEIPLDFIKPENVYIFFSHTIKGQKYNMPMLKKMIDVHCTLIDYERIVDEKGARLLFFGIQAGQAGMIETLWAFGQRLLKEGISNPFSKVQRAYKYGSLVDAKEDIQKIGWTIKREGFSHGLTPLICGFAGYGNVSQGSQEIFDLLPFEEIKPENLETFFKQKNYSSNRIYKVIFTEKDMVQPIHKNKRFDLQDYYDNPQKYQSIFEQYLPYLDILINGIFWTMAYPRLVTKKYLRKAWIEDTAPKLKVIGDISCDVGGSIECTGKATDPDSPVFVYNPLDDSMIDGFEGRGVVVMAIDNLPAEIPLESSAFFSDALMPYIPGIAEADFGGSFEDCQLPAPIKRAVLLYRGKFPSKYGFMKKYLE